MQIQVAMTQGGIRGWWQSDRDREDKKQNQNVSSSRV